MPRRLLLAIEYSPVTEYTDAATVYVDIQTYVTEEYPVLYVDIQASGVDVFEHIDAATVYIDITNTGGECFSSASAVDLGEGEANLEWYEAAYVAEWSGDATPEWSYGNVSVGEGC